MILDEIAAKTRIRVEAAKKAAPPAEVRRLAESRGADTGFPFERELARDTMTFICEVKKASPSRGVIAEEFDYLSIAEEYEAAGAGAISVLTEPDYFLGSLRYLEEIAQEVKIPLLRKDFTIDDYMIYEAKAAGASAVLLICALLGQERLAEYIGLCDALGLSALVEAHDEAEIDMAVGAGARIIGVNNRNLKDFTVDIRNGVRLRSLVPPDILFIAESGIRTREDIRELERGRVNGVLIGETLMRSPDKRAMLEQLKGVAHGKD